MYFKRLEIFGFKSFAEKTILNFEPGITAVVGPNGCGKSNIFDAIRWVLGEQSIKELRGSAMEDVIFNGTDRRQSLGFAEVSLTFSNESKMLPIEYDEVTVTRRLFRSGESEYLLNKTVVRLKDVLELFMGTGIGAEAYSLVQQGRVDLVVSARPEDRRMILDEAAGITKYKAKKKEAINKLKDTENNILRLNDIILEVKRQIGSIERQANKARRYKEEFESLKNLEVRLARFQLEGHLKEKGVIENILSQFSGKESELNQEIERLTNLIHSENNLLGELEQKINSVHEQDLKLENQVEMENKHIHFNEERLKEVVIDDERLVGQKAQAQERSSGQQEKISAVKEAMVTFKEQTQKNVRILEEKRERLIAIAREIKEKKESIREDEESILNLTSQQVTIKNELTEVMKEFQGYLARKRRLEMENSKVISEKEEVDQRLRSVDEDMAQCNQKIAELKGQCDAKSQTAAQLKERLAGLENTLNELEKKKLLLISQKEFIEELRVQYQDMPDPVVEGTLLTSNPPSQNNKGIIGKVKGVQPLDTQRQEMLKNTFPQFSNLSLYEVTCETKFIELDPQQITAKIEELTSDIGLQTRQKETTIAEIKEKEDLIANINSAVHDQEKVLSSYQAQRSNILDEVNKLLGELDLVDAELREAKNAMVSLKSKEDEYNRQLELLDGQIQGHQQAIKEKQNQIATSSQEREETNVLIAQLETELDSVSEKEKDQRENLKIFEEALTAALEEIKRIEQAAVENKAKKEKLKIEITESQSKINALKEKRESLKTVFAEHENNKTEVAGRLAESRRNLTQTQKGIEEVKGQAHQQQMRHQELTFGEKAIKDKLLQAYKINLDELALEIQLPSAVFQDALPQGDSAGQPVPQSGAQESIVPAQDAAKPQQPLAPINAEELTAEIERLKKRCDSFGSVNLVAIEEYDELKQRFEFLTKQQSDLLTAKESLNGTISKINRTTRQLFLDTFTKVSEEFRIYFRMLFGGGEAQLILVDPENVLESGIEIIARPPGKKLQNISLLSGGEKTLAAIALIFGVFKVRPSPFCVLDEIDAALDESNVGRFGYLLKDFAKISQFIVITHNKKTIVNADVMYGITMQETGISKIVSVKFGEKQEKKEEMAVGV